MPDEFDYLDDLVAEADRAGGTGANDDHGEGRSPESTATMPPPDDYFVQAAPATAPGSVSEEGPTDGAPPTETPPRPARSSLDAAREVTRRPGQSNRLGALAAFLGVVGLALGITLPWFVMLIVLTAGAGAVLGGMTVRHSVNTRAPGLWVGLAGLLTGLAGLVMMFVGLTDASQGMRDTTDQLTGLMGGFQAVSDAAEIESMTLPGTGAATVTLDGAVIEIPLEGCGFSDPAPGVALAGHGTVYEPRLQELAFSSERIGSGGDLVVVTLGPNSYVLRTEPGLLVVEGDSVVAAGTFRSTPGGDEVEGHIEASCDA